MRDVWMALGMFVLVFVADFIWTWWSRAVATNNKRDAVVASVLIYMIGGITVLGYVEHWWMVFPAGAGAALGTWFAMTFKLSVTNDV